MADGWVVVGAVSAGRPGLELQTEGLFLERELYLP